MLLAPDFEALKTRPIALLPPAAIVLGASVLWLLGSAVARRTLPAVPVTGWTDHPAFLLLQVPAGALVAWAFSSFLLSYLAGLEVRAAWAVAGWVELPLLLAATLTLLLALALPVQAALNPVPAEARELSVWLASYWGAVERSPFSRLSHYLFLGAGLWSVWLLFGALKGLGAKRLYLTLAVFAVLLLL